MFEIISVKCKTYGDSFSVKNIFSLIFILINKDNLMGEKYYFTRPDTGPNVCTSKFWKLKIFNLLKFIKK